MAFTFTDEELTKLSYEAQVANDERRKKYGVVGVKQLSDPSRFVIPTDEQGARLVSVTLEDGTIVKADAGRVIPAAGARVTLRIESNRWIILGADDREALSTSSNTTINTTRHSHNIGAPSGLFYPVDPASVNDGMLLPTGNGLNVTVGRVTYPKTDGTIGIYDSNGTLDFASAVSGLSANESRWAIAYVDKSDGSVDYHIATAGTAPLNTTTDLEDAIADCLDSVANAYPYHAVRIRAGISIFSSYKMMAGRSVDDKDFIRLVSLAWGGAKFNLSATTAPTVNNDVDEGYVVSSRWFDTTNDKEYVCLDNTDGAAVWIETTQSGGGGSIGGSTGATDNVILRANGTGGDTIQASGITIDDSNTLEMADNVIERAELLDYSETLVIDTDSGTTHTIDLTTGNHHSLTLTDDCTLTFSNPSPTGKACSFTLRVIQDGTGGHTLTYPASVDWAGGTAPTLTATANATDFLTFLTYDAGTTWYGFVGGLDLS